MAIKLSWRTIILGSIAAMVLFGVLAGVSVATWEYTNSDAFCSNACHAVHPEEPYAHRESQHASVQCVECHIGRMSTFKQVAIKATHIKHAWGLLVGYERPLTAPSMPASRDSCEGCHSTKPHRNNTVQVRRHFAPDETNTETRVALIVRAVGRQAVDDPRRGIRWHTENQVRFVANDPQRENISWIEAVRPDGSVVTYTDSGASATKEEMGRAEKKIMECADCHNQAGHPFRNPEELIDEALAEDPVIRQLPYVKARMLELLDQDFETDEEARALTEQAWTKYKEDFPRLPVDYPDAWAQSKEFMRERIEIASELVARSKFRTPGVSWRSFPDHSGHSYSAGCFRCHNGKHQDAAGNPLPANCTLCHSVPIGIREGEIPKNLLALADMPKPESHRQPDFIGTHRTAVDDTCAACHGESRFGTDDKTFCANSGCHGRTWPNRQLGAR